MLKPTLIAAALGFALLGPAYAQDMLCDEATMSMMNQDIEKLQDQKAKQDAMREMAVAKTAMENNDMPGCVEHMQRVAKDLKKT